MRFYIDSAISICLFTRGPRWKAYVTQSNTGAPCSQVADSHKAAAPSGDPAAALATSVDIVRRGRASAAAVAPVRQALRSLLGCQHPPTNKDKARDPIKISEPLFAVSTCNSTHGVIWKRRQPLKKMIRYYFWYLFGNLDHLGK